MEPLLAEDPRVVGGYEIVGRVGVGGMGIVYLAHSPGGRRAALKLVRVEIADDPEFRDRFRREIGAARQVGGAFTAPVLDADPDAPQPWLATVYVDGPSLRDRVAASGPMSERQTRLLGAGLAEALRAMHRVGLVHRDVKPGNVLLAADGPRLIDFGIIRSDALTDLTASGYVLGSAGFMAPEQAEGLRTGPAADVFALGAVLTFAATGAGPFGSGPAATLLVRTVEGESDLSRVPDGLRELITRCLAGDPADRPSDDDLLTMLNGSARAVPGPRQWPGTSANPGPVVTAPAPADPVMPRLVRRRTLVRNAVLGSLGVSTVVAVAAITRVLPSTAKDAHTGGSSDSSVPGTLLWRQSTPIQATDVAGMTLALDQESLYVIGDGVSAVDPSTGAQTWHIGSSVLDGAKADQASALVAPLVTNPGVLFLMIPGTLLQLVYINGPRAFSYDFEQKGPSRLVGIVGSLFICDTGHATPGAGGPPTVVGMEWDKTTAVWTKAPDPDEADYTVAVGPDSDVAVLDFGAETLTLFRATDGTRLWQTAVPTSGAYPSVAFTDNAVFHGGGTIGKYAEADGHRLWEVTPAKLPPGTGYRILGADGSRLYVTTAAAGDQSAAITALDAKNGSWIWTSAAVPVALAPTSAPPSVVVSGEAVLVTDYGQSLTALNVADGSVRWVMNTTVSSSPGTAGIAADGNRVFWAAAGMVQAFVI